MEHKRLRGIAAIRESVLILSAPPDAEETALIRTLATATEELLKDEDFEIRPADRYIQIVGTGPNSGHSVMTLQSLMWRSDLPPDDKLEMILDSFARRLQQFVSAATHQQWPEPNAVFRVRRGESAYFVEWCAGADKRPILRMKAIPRERIEPKES